MLSKNAEREEDVGGMLSTDWVSKIKPWMAGLLLTLIGSLLLFRFHDWPTIHALGEATFIAGLLALCIDPYVKRSLIKEASLGIFHHLIGFDQEPEIRERIREITTDTVLYRHNCELDCKIESHNSAVRLNVECRFEVINPSNKTMYYAPKLQFEVCEKAEVYEMSAIGEEIITFKDPVLVSGETGVVEALGPKTSIKPRRKGYKYRFCTKHSVTLPPEYFTTFNFGTPTVNLSLKLESPRELDAHATPASRHSEGRYEYDRLFMPGEHITIKWWHKPT